MEKEGEKNGLEEEKSKNKYILREMASLQWVSVTSEGGT